MHPSSPDASDRRRAEAPVDGTSALQGALVGPYRLVRELGQGGMDIVNLAEWADGPFEQRVALKLIERGMDNEDILRRFLAERQELVDFGIAKLLYEDGAGRSVTRTDQRLMTPDCATPEEVRGEPVRTSWWACSGCPSRRNPAGARSPSGSCSSGARRIDSGLAREPELQAELLDMLGVVHRDLGLYPEADSLLQRAVRLSRATYGETHSDVAARLDRSQLPRRRSASHGGGSRQSRTGPGGSWTAEACRLELPRGAGRSGASCWIRTIPR